MKNNIKSHFFLFSSVFLISFSSVAQKNNVVEDSLITRLLQKSVGVLPTVNFDTTAIIFLKIEKIADSVLVQNVWQSLPDIAYIDIERIRRVVNGANKRFFRNGYAVIAPLHVFLDDGVLNKPAAKVVKASLKKLQKIKGEHRVLKTIEMIIYQQHR